MMKSSNQSTVNQILSIILQNKPFPPHLLPSSNPLTSQTISSVLCAVPRLLFPSPSSVGRQCTLRHRSPLKQRSFDAYCQLTKPQLAARKTLEFYHWAGSCGTHNESTCKEMAIVLAKAHELKLLWNFLIQMSRRGLVNLVTVTCLIKVLGEEGLVKQALDLFYRMKRFHFKPDVYAYNVMIHALCKVGKFGRARFMLEQMELPGWPCPPDRFTYTILISCYCKYALQTGCKKAVRRRMWEANHLFRIMLFKGFVPDVVTYNCLIDGCCKSYRIERALELFEDMGKRGCVPNRVTYNSFVRYYSAVNEIDKAVEMLRKMKELNHGHPSSSSYTPIIHALCEAGRVVEARDFLAELVDLGSTPREYTYKLVCDALDSIGEASSLTDELRKRIANGVENRYRQTMKVKPIMRREILVQYRDKSELSTL